MQLCRIGLEHPDIHFEIFYGASNNERSWWDNHRAYDLGYRPTGRAEDFREHAFAEQAKLKPDPVGDFYQGGAFCGMEFDGDTERDHRLEMIATVIPGCAQRRPVISIFLRSHIRSSSLRAPPE